MQWRRSI